MFTTVLRRSVPARASSLALPRAAVAAVGVAPRVALPARAFSSSSSSSSSHSSSSNFTAYATAAAITAAAIGGVVASHDRPKLSLNAATFTDDINVPRSQLPVIDHPIVMCPNVPPPITRKHRAVVKVNFESTVIKRPIRGEQLYEFWTFNDGVPGPFIRCRVGDVLDFSLTNKDESGMLHNVDFHAVTGPGGGAEQLNAENGETRRGYFKMLHPGLFMYHCAVGPVPVHVANGMYGMILVEPKEGLPKVDKEFSVLQSEFYFETRERETKKKGNGHGHGKPKGPSAEELAEEEEHYNTVDFSYEDGMAENPKLVLFNGKDGALRNEGTLQVKQNDRVRIFFCNAGPNLISSFHIIGTIFDKVYREADLISPPARSVQTTTVPAGGAAVVELDFPVPGNFTIVDHALFRLEKGAVGFINVTGEKKPEIFDFEKVGKPCANCNVHP